MLIDEIDNLKFREVAMSRYKRNHEFISDIFSAYSVSKLSVLNEMGSFLIKRSKYYHYYLFKYVLDSIIPPNSVYQEKNIDELKQQLVGQIIFVNLIFLIQLINISIIIGCTSGRH